MDRLYGIGHRIRIFNADKGVRYGLVRFIQRGSFLREHAVCRNYASDRCFQSGPGVFFEHYGKCACGRTLVRMDKVMGRSDDMLIIRGVNVFPSQIESVLLAFDNVEPHYMIYIDRVDNLDVMEIDVEMTGRFFSDSVKDIEKYENQLRHEIQSAIGVSARIRLVEPRSIPRSEGKAKRVIDRRKLFTPL
ncbi:hypothetical protein EOM86_07545 [Candidatus Nomurabacteria bacterium]|nr:hypothetical protein [Candidatus Nomurabacteria bacterium]